MARIQQRTNAEGQTSWRVQIRIKGSAHISKTFARKTDAVRWAERMEADIRRGLYLPTPDAMRRTVAEALDRYEREVLPTKARTTQASQRAQLAFWRERLGPLFLADVTPALIVEAREATLAEGLSPALWNRRRVLLSHVFTVAAREWGWATDNPVKRVQPSKESRGRTRFLDRDKELPALLDAVRAVADKRRAIRTAYHEARAEGLEHEAAVARCCEAHGLPVPSRGGAQQVADVLAHHDDTLLADVVLLALCTGARKNELLTLRWPHVDLHRAQLRFLNTKNGEKRVVPLVPEAVDMLQRRRRLRHLQSDWVFPAKTKPDVPASVDREFIDACKVAGLEDFTFHDLRHTAASYLAMAGCSLTDIAEVIGHRDIRVTRRYAHLCEAHTRRVVERLGHSVFGTTPEREGKTG